MSEISEDEPEKQAMTDSGSSGARSGGSIRVGSGDGRGPADSGSTPWPEEPYFANRPRVVVCEPKKLLRTGLTAMLSPFSDIVGEAVCGVDLIELIRALLPDLVIINIALEDIGGVEVCRRIIQESHQIAVLVCTDSYYATKYYNQLVRIGVQGVCLNSSGPEALFEAIEQVINSRFHSEPRIVQLVKQPSSMSKHDFGLTEQEVAVLTRLDLRSKEISEELDLDLSAVERCIKSILGKLKVPTRTAAALTAVQHGFVLLPVMQSRDLVSGLTEDQKRSERFAREAIRKQRERD